MYKGKFKGKPKPPSFVSCIPRKDKLSEHSSHCHFTVIANFDLNLMYSNFILFHRVRQNKRAELAERISDIYLGV